MSETEQSEKYAYAEANTPDGWGIAGVFPKDVVDDALANGDAEGLIIEERHLIVGQGGGWDSAGTFDEEWLRKACDAINRMERDKGRYE